MLILRISISLHWTRPQWNIVKGPGDHSQKFQPLYHCWNRVYSQEDIKFLKNCVLILNKRNLPLRAQAQNLIEILGTSCSSSPHALNRLGTASRHGRLSAGGSILGCEGRACPLSLMVSSPVQLSLLDNFIINLFINSSAADWERKQGQRACQISGSTRHQTPLRARGRECWSRRHSATLPRCFKKYHIYCVYLESNFHLGRDGERGKLFLKHQGLPTLPPVLPLCHLKCPINKGYLTQRSIQL